MTARTMPADPRPLRTDAALRAALRELGFSLSKPEPHVYRARLVRPTFGTAFEEGSGHDYESLMASRDALYGTALAEWKRQRPEPSDVAFCGWLDDNKGTL